MIFEEETLVWIVLIFELVIALVLIFGAKSQPFPRPARRFGNVLLTVSCLLLLGQSAPNPASLSSHLVFLSIYGAIGIIVGINHMLRTRREVLVAPMSGFMFCIGVGGLMVQTWDDLTKLEHWAGFLALVVLAGGQVWLVFRGLLIGRLPLAWSQAGMVALSRGQLTGGHGAIECFEKAWDADEEHLNPMAYSALFMIHKSLGNENESLHWQELFLESGGKEAVAPEWLDAIKSFLTPISNYDIEDEE